MATLKDINLLDVGNTLQLAGAIYADDKRAYLCMFPDEQGYIETEEGNDCTILVQKDGKLITEALSMDQDEWVQFIRQTDLLEVEAVVKEGAGQVGKAIIRKSTRQIEQGVSWQVYRRDNVKCRYCGADNVPLTVDHLVLWEVGGPSTVENLVSACRKCNKTRGNTPYEEWLQHPFYLKVSKNLSPEERQANEALLSTLSTIPIRPHQRSR